jgi:uncharacterized protein
MFDSISNLMVYDIIEIAYGSWISSALYFIQHDNVKISVLIAVIIFIIYIVCSFFSPEKTRKIISHKKEFICNPFNIKMSL